MGGRASSQRPSPKDFDDMRIAKDSYFSLLPGDVFALCQPYISAALNIPRLGQDIPFNSTDPELSIDPAIFELVPRTCRLALPSIEKLCVAQRGDTPLGGFYTSKASKTFVICTRRGVVTPNGYYPWMEIRGLDYVRKEKKLRLGRVIEVVREAPLSTEWDAFMEKLQSELASNAALRSSVPSALSSAGSAVQWSTHSRELAERLAAVDPSDAGLRRAIVTLARDLHCRPLYPAIPPSVLSPALAACNVPTDHGVILLQHFIDHKGFRMLELIITDTHLVWAPSTQTSPKTVHTLSYSTFGSTGGVSSQTLHSTGHTDFRFAAPDQGVDVTIGAPNLVPARDSRHVFIFLTALRHILFAREKLAGRIADPIALLLSAVQRCDC